MRKDSKMKRDIDVIISGYYGYKNSGDDSLLKAIIENLRSLKPDIKITVLSVDTKETRQMYGVNAINRFNFLSLWFLLGRTKLLISGGGSLIQDQTSTHSLLYYLTVIRIAVMRKTKVMLYSNGIGPVFYRKNRRKTRKVLNDVDCITLRDSMSYNELANIGIDTKKVIITADPAYSLLPAAKDRVNDILRNEGVPPEKDYFTVSIRSWKYMDSDFTSQIADAANYICKKYGLTAVFIPMQFKLDYNIEADIAGKMAGSCVILKDKYYSPEILGIIEHSKFIIGMRLHTLIYASRAGTPMIGISYDPKIEGLMDYLGQGLYIDLKDVKSNIIKEYADKIMPDRTELSEALKHSGNIAVQKSAETAKIAIDLLTST